MYCKNRGRRGEERLFGVEEGLWGGDSVTGLFTQLSPA